MRITGYALANIITRWTIDYGKMPVKSRTHISYWTDNWRRCIINGDTSNNPELVFLGAYMQHGQAPGQKIGAIVLAAGSSSRMGGGRHKLLLPLGERSVIRHVVDAIIRSQARPLVVVVGHQADRVRAAITDGITDEDVSIVENPAYLQGMSTSIHVGLRELIKNDRQAQAISGALIMLGDQPLMTERIINALIGQKTMSGRRIIAPLYGGKRGNPVLFDANLFAELLTVSGDEGGRSVLQRYREDIANLEVGDVTASFDVDTWDAYQQVVTEWQRQQK
jgi:molybdenum cofactor cytidylyltransferase